MRLNVGDETRLKSMLGAFGIASVLASVVRLIDECGGTLPLRTGEYGEGVSGNADESCAMADSLRRLIEDTA